MDIFNTALDTPWKIIPEILQILVSYYAGFILRLNGIGIGQHAKFYGLPKIQKHRQSEIIIGDNFENRNWWDSNPLGINHPLILTTWAANARIVIGNDVGISGGSICAAAGIQIGDGTIIGANCTIIDTDFHPLKSENRRYSRQNIRTVPVLIGKNVFIGTGCIILKGAIIPDNTIVPAGSVIATRNTPAVKPRDGASYIGRSPTERKDPDRKVVGTFIRSTSNK